MSWNFSTVRNFAVIALVAATAPAVRPTPADAAGQAAVAAPKNVRVVRRTVDTTPPPVTPPPVERSPIVTTPQQVGPNNLVYEGAFRLPWFNDPAAKATFNYGGSAMAFNPAGRGSLFIVGHDWNQLVGEVSIPEIRVGAAVTNLATAEQLQPFGDPHDGKSAEVGGSAKVGGLLVHNGSLYSTAFIYYDALGDAKASHFKGGLNLKTAPDTQGPFAIQTSPSLSPGYVAGWMADIPANWQGPLGGNVLTGKCCISIISRTSSGPDAVAINLDQMGKTVPLTGVPLLYYSILHPLASMNGGLASAVGGMVFPSGTDSVLYFGMHGTGATCYGPGTTDRSLAGKTAEGGTWCYDPVSASKGYHAYPYEYYVWAYDAHDLAAVRAGTKVAWELKPYAEWALPLPFARTNVMQGISAAAYDAATGRIFLAIPLADDVNPLIHVVRVKMP